MINSPPLEEVHYLCDEIADIVWAIEHTAVGPDGIPVDCTARAVLARPLATPVIAGSTDQSAAPTLGYLLRTDIPGNWFPFLPPDNGLPVTTLTLATVPPIDKSSAAPQPLGEILAEQQAQHVATITSPLPAGAGLPTSPLIVDATTSISPGAALIVGYGAANAETVTVSEVLGATQLVFSVSVTNQHSGRGSVDLRYPPRGDDSSRRPGDARLALRPLD